MRLVRKAAIGRDALDRQGGGRKQAPRAVQPEAPESGKRRSDARVSGAVGASELGVLRPSGREQVDSAQCLKTLPARSARSALWPYTALSPRAIQARRRSV